MSGESEGGGGEDGEDGAGCAQRGDAQGRHAVGAGEGEEGGEGEAGEGGQGCGGQVAGVELRVGEEEADGGRDGGEGEAVEEEVQEGLVREGVRDERVQLPAVHHAVEVGGEVAVHESLQGGHAPQDEHDGVERQNDGHGGGQTVAEHVHCAGGEGEGEGGEGGERQRGQQLLQVHREGGRAVPGHEQEQACGGCTKQEETRQGSASGRAIINSCPLRLRSGAGW